MPKEKKKEGKKKQGLVIGAATKHAQFMLGKPNS